MGNDIFRSAESANFYAVYYQNGVTFASSTWFEAENHCISTYGTHLATIRDSTDLNEVSWVAGQVGANAFWIGLSDRNCEGCWSWADGNAMVFRCLIMDLPLEWW